LQRNNPPSTRSGWQSASWIEGAYREESWAVVEPSTHSTIRARSIADPDPDLIGFEVEEPASLEHFESLVEQGRRIDGDALPHRPGGVRQRFRRSHRHEGIERARPERAARRREDDSGHSVLGLSLQQLKEPTVLAVDRQDGHTAHPRLLRQEMPRNDEGLLVGESERLSGLQRSPRWAQASRSDQSVQDDVHFRERRNALRRVGTEEEFALPTSREQISPSFPWFDRANHSGLVQSAG
jgi:hypothetical protein